MTRLARAFAVCVAAASLVTTAAPHASALARPCAVGALHVAVVVDHGNGASVSNVCVPAKAGMTDADVLRARASMLGLPQPTTNSSGLLCSIDGTPASDCGKSTNGKYAYWSYWHGSGGRWSFSNDNFGTYRASEDVVQGWRWQPAGAANASDPAPRGSPDPTATCAPAPPAPAGSPSPPPANAPGAAAGHPGDSTASAARGTGPAAGTAPTTVAGGSTTTDTAAAAHERGTSATTFVGALGAGTSAPPHHATSSGPPVGLIVGIPIIAAFAIGGAVIARRRRAASPS